MHILDVLARYASHIKAHCSVLRQGDISEKIYYILHGCMRLWHNSDGLDTPLQFFQERQFVSSFESFYLHIESPFSLEAIENTDVLVLTKDDFAEISKKIRNCLKNSVSCSAEDS